MKFSLIALAFLLHSTNGFAQTPLEDLLFNSEKTVTDAILVQKDGQTVYEHYRNGYTAEAPHLLWSTTKSVVSTLIATAVQDGLITLDESVCENLPDRALYGDACGIKIRDLLSWSSGLMWSESYEGGNPATSSVIQMLAGDGKFDMLRFFLSHPVAYTPGSHFSYSTGDSTAMMGALKLALQKKGLDAAAYPWQALFGPLGIRQATLQTDQSGTVIGGALGYMTARELIKIGELYANKGRVNGKQIIPEWWPQFALSTVPGYDPSKNNFFLPQYSWWRFNPSQASREIPTDTFITLGHWGQYLIVIPSRKIIAVRFGNDRDRAFDIQQLVVLLLRQFAPENQQKIQASFAESDSTSELPPLPVYKAPVLSIGTHMAANLVCGCIFVSQLNEDYCLSYAKYGDAKVAIKVDRNSKSVDASFSGFQKAKSVWQNETLGCRLVQ